MDKDLTPCIYKRITLPISLTSNNAATISQHHSVVTNWTTSSVQYAGGLINNTQIMICKNYNGANVSSWDNWIVIGY